VHGVYGVWESAPPDSIAALGRTERKGREVEGTGDGKRVRFSIPDPFSQSRDSGLGDF